MFKKIKVYLIVGLILIIGLILVFNKILTIGFIVVGIAAFIFFLWELLLKNKVAELETLNQKLLDREEENKTLRDTVEDYSKRKLNISEINTILELGLFEVKTNFKRTVNKKFKVKDKNVQFIGVIDVDFIAKYGVDFTKLRFKIDEQNNEIFIANANPEFLAFTNRKTKWEIDEILEFNIPFLGSGHWRTNSKLDKIANDIKEDIRLQVEKDSENGPVELKWITEPLRSHIERALKLILGAQGYKLRLTELDGDDYRSFQEYIDEENTKESSGDTNVQPKELGQ